MKKLLFVLTIVALSTTVNAQSTKPAMMAKPVTFSVGLEVALPTGDFGKVYSVGYGASFQGEFAVANSVGVTLNAGYMTYAFKSQYGTGHAGFVPVMGGLKYNIAAGPYLHAQAGAAFGTSSGQGTSFVYAAGIGYGFTKAIDAELKYQAYSQTGGSLGSVGLRLAYNF
ncbi:hypothetical protein BH09BAC2_BH09BAC2_24020 [soil metagenome]